MLSNEETGLEMQGLGVTGMMMEMMVMVSLRPLGSNGTDTIMGKSSSGIN